MTEYRWDRDWYLEFKHHATEWRAMYSDAQTSTGPTLNENPQYLYLGNERYLNKIYLRTLPEIVYDLSKHMELYGDLVHSGERQYRLHHHKTHETIPGELFT